MQTSGRGSSWSLSDVDSTIGAKVTMQYHNFTSKQLSLVSGQALVTERKHGRSPARCTLPELPDGGTTHGCAPLGPG